MPLEPHRAIPGLAEHLPPLSEQEAVVESNRCLYCYDAPCTHACPTHIDVPRFIKKIATGNLLGSARTILESNLLGATCARVCPVQELCEGACVLGAEHKPIMIGRLQRYAMDHVAGHEVEILRRAVRNTGRVAVVGAGPAGLSCAGQLALRGYQVTLFERRPLGGGLSTYGIIVLREPMPVALAEVDMIRRLGVQVETGIELGVNLDLADLCRDFDAVFLGVGLGDSPSLNIPGEEFVLPGLTYIEQSKLDPSSVPLAREVVVVGAGNTAIDCATIARRLGAERVTMVYRRSETEMTAYPHEQEFVKLEGVHFEFLAMPAAVVARDGQVEGLECVRAVLGPPDASGRPAPVELPNSRFLIPAQQIIKAIGQVRPTLAAKAGLETDGGFIRVSADYETSSPGVYAGGDCIRAKGSASTVMAVQDGKLAAMAIDRRLGKTAREGVAHG